MQCDCPLAKGGMKCKHMAATLYALEHREKYIGSSQEVQNEIDASGSQKVQTEVIDGNKELHAEKESAYESEYDSVNNSANISTDDLAYKSAYETVYESINPSEEKTEKVEWHNQEDYITILLVKQAVNTWLLYFFYCRIIYVNIA